MALTLTRKRVAKNGIVSYKADSQRSTGTVYFDKKMFPNGAPETVSIEAEGIQVPEPKAPRAAAQPAAAETAQA